MEQQKISDLIFVIKIKEAGRKQNKNKSEIKIFKK